MKEKVIKAAENFLKGKGYEILERDFCGFDIVADDEGDIVFIEVNWDMEKLPEENEPDRAKIENASIKYIIENDHESCKIRYDMVDIAVINTKRALLRHHIDVLVEMGANNG